MDWRVKAVAQNIFSHLPKGHRFNYMFQEHVTRSNHLDEAAFLDIVSWGTSHVEAIRRHETRPLSELSFYEFGAGYHLVGPLTFFSYGVGRQLLIDITPLCRINLVNESIANFQQFGAKLGLPRLPRSTIDSADLVRSLRELYGISYRAPCDARATGLASNSVDCITSTNTLEHIDASDIGTILRECHRILRTDGIMSMAVDYADHYSFFDKSISEYNFLRYSDWAWRMFNPRLHFQNRLRHADYVRLFEVSEFEIIEERRREGGPEDVDALRRMAIAKRFAKYSVGDLAVRGAYFVLRKAQKMNPC
jgi:SAM-dependent methyltransferase